MDIVRSIMQMDRADLRYNHCQELGKMIEIELAFSNDPLRKKLVELLEYQNGDIEEYAILICEVIALLPKEKHGR